MGVTLHSGIAANRKRAWFYVICNVEGIRC